MILAVRFRSKIVRFETPNSFVIYCDRGIFVVNLGCLYSPQILVNTFLHGQGKEWGKFNRDWGYRTISQLGETFYYCMREFLSQYPRILYSLLCRTYRDHKYKVAALLKNDTRLLT